MKPITPEVLLNEAVLAINKGQWDKAVALAATGLLKATIDASKPK